MKVKSSLVVVTSCALTVSCGYGHHWYVDRQNRLTVVALSNTAIEGMVGGFVGELRNAVYGNGDI
jgi:CubicO group peptidase (beta-lactamase class C family)